MPSYTLTEEQRAVAFAAVQVASEAAALLRCVADDDDTTIGEPQATLEDLLELRCALAPEPDAGGEITYTVAAHKSRQRRAEFLAKEAERLASDAAAKQRAADEAELARLQAKLGVPSSRPQYVEPGDESWRNTPGRVKTGGAT